MSDMGLVGIADSLKHIAAALHKLGVADAFTPMGALEHVAIELKEGSQRIADSISELAEAVRELVE